MCCFKRLAAKIKRKAGWARKERPPAVTRPGENSKDRKKIIDLQKSSAQQCKKRNERRRSSRSAKDEACLRVDFFKQKGWAT